MPDDPGTTPPSEVDGISTLATFDGASSSAKETQISLICKNNLPRKTSLWNFFSIRCNRTKREDTYSLTSMFILLVSNTHSKRGSKTPDEVKNVGAAHGASIPRLWNIYILNVSFRFLGILNKSLIYREIDFYCISLCPQTRLRLKIPLRPLLKHLKKKKTL